MQSENKFFADLAKVLNGAAGTVAGMGREAGEGARERAKEWFAGMDFVSREEFDAVKDMAAKAREEADMLKKRVDALEAGSKGSATTKKPAARKKPAAIAKKPAAGSAARKQTASPKPGSKPATK